VKAGVFKDVDIVLFAHATVQVTITWKQLVSTGPLPWCGALL
jgi:hypothetical protein